MDIIHHGGEIENCYYVESDLNGCGTDRESNKIYQKNQNEMKTESFVELLNNGTFTYNKDDTNSNEGYPVADITAPETTITYSDINEDTVTVSITCDEKVRKISGWKLSSDLKTLTKTYYLNTNAEVIIEDYNYNARTIQINISDLQDSKISTGDYYINNVDDFLLFAEEVNKGNNFEGRNIYLNNNITISNDTNYLYQPIGNGEVPFKGNFYGNGHIISGIFIEEYLYDKGLFGYIEEAKIRDLTVEGTITGEARIVGSIAAVSSKSTIENCTSNVTISCANNRDDNHIDTTWGMTIGGIIGNNITGSTIKNCNNNGNIYCDSVGSSSSVGGISGYSWSSTIEKSNNKGNIETTRVHDIGGIVGDVYYQNSKIKECYNNGNIKLNSVPQGAGGIVGDINVGEIENCYNTGNIEYTGTVTGNGTANIKKIGGIVGETYNTVTIKNCYNIGDVGVGAGVAGIINDERRTNIK